MANDMTLAFGAAGVAARDCRPTPVCDPRPVCPACGGLECLCRPRFFAGQLLTEEDLNRLDHYIVAKNRLHNRHLFGTGVVCGLDVVCSTCNPAGNSAVVVRPGYALSPCGNDIVVCRDEVVDICDLINRCRPKRDDCVEPGRSGPAPADDHHARGGEEEWVLAICYHEKPSRGITSLRGSSCGCGCGGSCGCGGGHLHGSHGHGAGTGEASCGCGGGGTKPARTRPAAKPTPRPPQCEPTLTCEGYTFAVYKVPRTERERQVDPGALIKRFICCLVPLFEQMTKLPSGQVTPTQMYDWLTNLIDVVRDFLAEEGLYDCDAVRKLDAILVPVPKPSEPLPAYMHSWQPAFERVLEVIGAVFQKCLCGALLPPCPGPELNDCVPIATITVTRDRCAVRHICNIANRRFLVTWPSVQYWLSWLPLFSNWIPAGSTLGKLIERICCTPIAGRFAGVTTGEINVRPPVQPAIAATHGTSAAAVSAAGERHPFTQLMAEALIDGGRVDAATLLLAGLGATKKDGTPLASAVDLQYPGQAMLTHQVIAPAIAPLVPLLSALGSGAADTSGLERTVASLKETVEKQQAAIDKLLRG